MIQKEDFYHGAAFVPLIDHPAFEKMKKQDFGYLVNQDVFLFPKYRTRARSPWQFNFSDEEISRLNTTCSEPSISKVIVILICGGDGICAVLWEEIARILTEDGGWLSVRRNFKECYGVSGKRGTLERKVSLRRWPLLVFDQVAVMERV
jgi:hypothetical protein